MFGLKRSRTLLLSQKTSHVASDLHLSAGLSSPHEDLIQGKICTFSSLTIQMKWQWNTEIRSKDTLRHICLSNGVKRMVVCFLLVPFHRFSDYKLKLYAKEDLRLMRKNSPNPACRCCNTLVFFVSCFVPGTKYIFLLPSWDLKGLFNKLLTNRKPIQGPVRKRMHVFQKNPPKSELGLVVFWY